ncbi:MAG: HPP family protein [Moraxellaceae bacterium]
MAGNDAATERHGRRALLGGLGAFLAILLLQGLAELIRQPLLLAPFGASCVLLFLAPGSEFSRTRNLLAGYAIGTVAGFAVLWLWPGAWWSVALAVGGTIALMRLSHTVHPPAGAHPIVIVLTAPALKALLPTLGIGLAVLLVSAWGYQRMLGRASA